MTTDTQIIASAITRQELKEFSSVKEMRMIIKERTGYSVPLTKIEDYIEDRNSMLPHWAECE